MSDFGAIIIFSKSNSSISDEEKEIIQTELKRVIKSGDYSSIIEEGNYLELKNWDEDKLCSMITEYYIDENFDEIFEFAKEEDTEDLEDIISKLNLDTSIEISSSFEEW